MDLFPKQVGDRYPTSRNSIKIFKKQPSPTRAKSTSYLGLSRLEKVELTYSPNPNAVLKLYHRKVFCQALLHKKGLIKYLGIARYRMILIFGYKKDNLAEQLHTKISTISFDFATGTARRKIAFSKIGEACSSFKTA